MTAYERRITKEQYKRAVQNGRYLTDDDMQQVFSRSERCGYGIYSPIVFERDGDFYVRYRIGDCCD